jgi:hypothetical protein
MKLNLAAGSEAQRTSLRRILVEIARTTSDRQAASQLVAATMKPLPVSERRRLWCLLPALGTSADLAALTRDARQVMQDKDFALAAEALEFVRPFLEDHSLSASATAVSLELATPLVESHPALVKTTCEDILSLKPSPDLQNTARKLLAEAAAKATGLSTP